MNLITYSSLMGNRKQNLELVFFLAGILVVLMIVSIIINLINPYSDLSYLLISAVYLLILGFFYFYRIHFFSLALIFSFMFSLILGIPSVYLILISTDIEFKQFLISVVWVSMFLLSICPLFETQKVLWRESLKFSQFFYIIFSIVSICQFYKILVYASFLISSGLGHLAIYSEGDKLHASVPFIIRAISGFSNVLGLVVFLFPASKRLKFVGLILVASDLIIGIRNKFFFSLMAIFILVALQNKEKGLKLFKRMTGIVPIIAVFILLSIVSYMREGYSIDFTKYLLIVLDSLSSTVLGIKDVLHMSAGSDVLAGIDPTLVIRQFYDLIGIKQGGSTNSMETIAQAYTHVALPDAIDGIALSSSILLESLVISPSLFPFVLFLYCVLFIILIDRLLNIKNITMNLCGVAMLPFLFYTTRAEMVQPLVALFKAFPVVLISYCFFTRTESFNEKNPDQ